MEMVSLFILFEYMQGGAGSEAWNRVYMIASVKKFGRVGMCTNFNLTNMAVATKENLHLVYACLCWFNIISLIPSLNIQGKVAIAFFFTFFLSDLVVLSAFSCTDFATSFEGFSDTFDSEDSPFSFTKNCRSRRCPFFIYIHCRFFFLYRNYPEGVNN